MSTPTQLYYTQADLQYRYWVLANCIADKGAHICCEKQNGNNIPAHEILALSKAVAFLNLICDYTPLAPLKYEGESKEVIESTNCISEIQMDKIMAWLENYCCVSFFPKETAPSKANGNLDLAPPIFPGIPFIIEDECLLELENGYLLLLESNEGIRLEDATCNAPDIPGLENAINNGDAPNWSESFNTENT